MSSRKALRKTVSGYTRFRNAQSVVPRLRKEPDELVRKMLLIGYLTERLEKKKPESVYIVGGQAVETYTAGQFKTGDIDIAQVDEQYISQVDPLVKETCEYQKDCATTNPNGSLRDIAGILSRERNVMGMMPHPERCSESILGCADGLLVFKSIAASLTRV